VSFQPGALLGAARAFAVMCLVALVMIEIFFLFRAGPMLYWEGVRRVNADHDPNYLAVFAGQMTHHFFGYFTAAYLLKEPIAAIALAAIGAAVLLRRKSMPRLDGLFLFLPPIVLLGVYSVGAGNLGIRYIIPVLPFAHLAGGAGLAWLLGKAAPWARVTAVALCGWSIAAAAGIYPDHLSYFNESACALENASLTGLDGGSRCGPAWLDDSNVDWGEGLEQLRTWLARNAGGLPVHILYFGTYGPEHYGIRHTPPGARGSNPELYILSAHMVARMSITEEQVRSATPIAIVGHAFWVYKF
jgi:hypothetical protein